MRYQCWLIPISVLQQEVPTALPQRKRKTWRVKDDTLRLSRLELFFFSIRCSLIFTPDACELHHWRWNRIMPHEKLYVKPLLGSIISPQCLHFPVVLYSCIYSIYVCMYMYVCLCIHIYISLLCLITCPFL